MQFPGNWQGTLGSCHNSKLGPPMLHIYATITLPNNQNTLNEHHSTTLAPEHSHADAMEKITGAFDYLTSWNSTQRWLCQMFVPYSISNSIFSFFCRLKGSSGSKITRMEVRHIIRAFSMRLPLCNNATIWRDYGKWTILTRLQWWLEDVCCTPDRYGWEGCSPLVWSKCCGCLLQQKPGSFFLEHVTNTQGSQQ